MSPEKVNGSEMTRRTSARERSRSVERWSATQRPTATEASEAVMPMDSVPASARQKSGSPMAR